MEPNLKRYAHITLGYRAAIFATVFGIVYIIAQIFEWTGFLGSHGGPESSSTPMGIVLLLTPSLLLGVSFAFPGFSNVLSTSYLGCQPLGDHLPGFDNIVVGTIQEKSAEFGKNGSRTALFEIVKC